MLIKAHTMENGVGKDIILDPNRDWLAIRFSERELIALATFRASEVFIAAPNSMLASNPNAIAQWARDWPARFYGGSHKPSEGGLILPNGAKIIQDGNK